MPPDSLVDFVFEAIEQGLERYDVETAMAKAGIGLDYGVLLSFHIGDKWRLLFTEPAFVPDVLATLAYYVQWRKARAASCRVRCATLLASFMSNAQDVMQCWRILPQMVGRRMIEVNVSHIMYLGSTWPAACCQTNPLASMLPRLM